MRQACHHSTSPSEQPSLHPIWLARRLPPAPSGITATVAEQQAGHG